MRRILGVLVVVGLALLSAQGHGDAAPSTAEAMTSLGFLVGTWNCAHTVGDFSGTYSETFTEAMDGRWLKQTYEFPATKTEPAVRAEYFIEYDQRIPRWVRFGAHSNGQYYGMYSKSDGSTSWDWEYVLPGPGASATWIKTSATQYTIDGPTYPENGKLVTEHHVCKKQ